MNPGSILVSAIVAAWAGNYAATHVGKSHYEKQCGNVEVFDLGYATVPQYNVPWYIEDTYAFAWAVSLLTIPWATTTSIFSSVVYRYAALLALRAVTTTVTILPKQEPCDDEFSWRMLFMGQCYDKVFSGHMALAVLISLSFVSHGVWPVWIGWMYPMGMALMMLVTRGHYTIDIVLGAALAILTWYTKLPLGGNTHL